MGAVKRVLAVGIVFLMAAVAPVGAGDDADAADATGRVTFGAYPQTTGGRSRTQATQDLESLIGRKLEVVRVFESWENPFPDAFHTFLRTGGRTAIISVKPIRANGTRVDWASIAGATPGSPIDTEIRSWANRLRDYRVPVYVSFHHEPEAQASSAWGTADQFVAAWRKWVTVFREQGASNVKFMWITTDYAHWLPTTDRRYAPKWYPGDAWVDAIAIDAYNWATCRPNADNPWKSLEQIIAPFRDFGAGHPDEEMWLAEYGTWEDPAVAGRKAAWFDEARALFARPAYSQFVGISYFNSPGKSAVPDCDWNVDTSSSSISSFTGMGADPLYQGDPDTSSPPANRPPVAAFSSTCTNLTCAFDSSASTDPDGVITGRSWTFGDATTATGSAPNRTYASAGTYTVTLTVTDDDGATTSISHDVIVTAPGTAITFVAAGQTNANALTHRVTVPAAVREGDGLLLITSINTTATINAPTGVTGWQPLSTVTAGSTTTRVYRKVAGAADAGRVVSIALSAQSKANVVIAAYRGTSTTDPVAAFAGVRETVSRVAHPAPSASVAAPGTWVVSYWSHKDATTSALAAPPGVTSRASGTQSGSGRVTALLADTGGPAAVGTYSAGSASAATAATTATMWTIVLAPG